MTRKPTSVLIWRYDLIFRKKCGNPGSFSSSYLAYTNFNILLSHLMYRCHKIIDPLPLKMESHFWKSPFNKYVVLAGPCIIELSCSYTISSGSAVTKNLLAKNYKVTSLYDVHKSRCEEFASCKIAKTPREITEENDIIITGILIFEVLYSKEILNAKLFHTELECWWSDFINLPVD